MANDKKELTEQIMQMLSEGLSQTEIAERLGVSQGAVSMVKNGKKYSRYAVLYISGLSHGAKEALKNIAKNKGMGVNPFLRMEIRKIIDASPDHLKRPPLNY